MKKSLLMLIVAACATGPGAFAQDRKETTKSDPAATKPAAAAPVADATKPAAQGDDAGAIQALVDEFTKAFNAGDAEAAAATYTESALVVDEEGNRVEGRDAVREQYAAGFAEAPGRTIAIRVDSFRFLGPETALEEGEATIQPAGDGGSPELSRFTVVYVKQDGRWLQAAVRDEFVGGPTPHERLQELEWMIGEWVNESQEAIVQTTCKWTDDGNFLVRDFTMKTQGEPVLSGTQRIGWDPVRKQIRSWVFDSEGGFGQGEWTRNGDQWIIKAEGIRQDGQHASATNIITFLGVDRASWQSVDRTIGDLALPGVNEFTIVPGKPDDSFLFLSCARRVQPMMPPKTEDPLTSQEVSLVRLWIAEGAKAPTTMRIKEKIVINLPPALVTPVRAVAVAPDGKTVAASRGNQVHLFELKTVPAAKKGEKDKTEWAFARSLLDPQLKTPAGKPAAAAHISLVESMAFSPDGKTLVTGSFQELTIWDVAKGEPRQRIGGFADRVCAIAFSPDGKKFATGGGAPTEDGEIKVFDAATGKLFTEVPAGHSDTVFAVAFSPDGKLLATGGADKFVKVWELPAEAGKPAKLAKSFEGHTHHVMGVGWTPDGKKLASCGADNLVKVWDYEKGEKLRDLQGHKKQVTALVFVGKTAQFVTGSGDASVRMWNADNGGNVRSFAGADDFVYAVGASADGAVIASGCEDGVVRVYDGKSGALLTVAVPPGAEPKK